LSKRLRKLVILGRDGVVNQTADQGILSTDAWQPLPGSLQAIARLNQAGYKVALATNQDAIAQGLLDLDTLNAMHQKLHDLLDRIGGHVDIIAYCPHGPDDNCDCRKPGAGMYRQIAERFDVELDGVPVIGDDHDDLQAALTVGAHPILVRTGKGAKTERTLAPSEGRIDVYDDLAQAVSIILAED
jgi:D-glycero-D-manno-heptose 1,7-bisphosphate phosphatase